MAHSGGVLVTYEDGGTRFVPPGATIEILTKEELREKFKESALIDKELLEKRVFYVVLEDLRSVDLFPPEYKAALPG
jgi:hypothetical protein